MFQHVLLGNMVPTASPPVVIVLEDKVHVIREWETALHLQDVKQDTKESSVKQVRIIDEGNPNDISLPAGADVHEDVRLT